jgi:hypothetical protein
MCPMARTREGELAISNFLRQHDLVQVLWVTLSSGTHRNTPDETARTLLREM